MGMLKKAIERFVERYEKNEYIKLLSPLNEVAVAIESDDDKIQFVCNEQGIFVQDDVEAKLFLFGTKEDLQKVLNGELRLQKGIMLNRIKYKGNFRALLMIESMFYLCKQKMS